MNLYFEKDTNLTSENGTVMDPITVCPFAVLPNRDEYNFL